jgi:hypothetical protein
LHFESCILHYVRQRNANTVPDYCGSRVERLRIFRSSLLQRDVRDDQVDHARQRWAVEWAGTTQLAQAGVKRDSLKVGDKVVISGRPSRVAGEYRVLMVNLSRPADGFTWGRGANEVVD